MRGRFTGLSRLISPRQATLRGRFSSRLTGLAPFRFSLGSIQPLNPGSITGRLCSMHGTFIFSGIYCAQAACLRRKLKPQWSTRTGRKHNKRTGAGSIKSGNGNEFDTRRPPIACAGPFPSQILSFMAAFRYSVRPLGSCWVVVCLRSRSIRFAGDWALAVSVAAMLGARPVAPVPRGPRGRSAIL
jgi:hypothetical protein